MCRLIFSFLSLSVILLANMSCAPESPAQESSQEIHDKYLEIMEIEDEETRILSELELSAYGTRDQQTRRADNLGLLRSRAAANKNEIWDFYFTFSKGLSINELANFIEANEFDIVTELRIQFVGDNDLVRTVAFTDFELYTGSPIQVTNFLVNKHYFILRTQREIGVLSDLPTESRFADPDSLRFYSVHGQMTAGNADLALSRYSSSILHVDMKKHPLGGDARRVPESEKTPVADPSEFRRGQSESLRLRR